MVLLPPLTCTAQRTLQRWQCNLQRQIPRWSPLHRVWPAATLHVLPGLSTSCGLSSTSCVTVSPACAAQLKASVKRVGTAGASAAVHPSLVLQHRSQRRG